MGVAAPFFLMTLFWGGIGGVAPFFLPKESPNRGLLQVIKKPGKKELSLDVRRFARWPGMDFCSARFGLRFHLILISPLLCSSSSFHNIPPLCPFSPWQLQLQMMLVITAICCYTFWLGTFLFQVNPLIGPMVDTNTVRVMKWQWGQSWSLNEGQSAINGRMDQDMIKVVYCGCVRLYDVTCVG